MAYKKFSADQIFDGYQLLDGGKVLITDEAGRVEGLVDRADAGDDIQEFSGILSPGFINCHCHLELSHMRGAIPEKTGLVDFVFNVMANRHSSEEAILQTISDAEQEMISNGIVAVGDICNTAFTIAQKKKEKIAYHNFIEVAGFVPAAAPSRFENALEIFNAFREISNEGRTTFSPHAPYSVSPELFELINRETSEQLITIHNQETKEENDFFLNKTGDFLRLYEKIGVEISFFNATGKSSLQTWLPRFNRDQSLLLVHNVNTSANDIAFLHHQITKSPNHQISFCLCPNANLYITGLLPDINMLLQNDSNIVLGTDSLASNHQLSILEEMKALQMHFPSLQKETLLQWATSNGAKALRMDDKLGSFEKGKKPGVLLLEGFSKVNRLL